LTQAQVQFCTKRFAKTEKKKVQSATCDPQQLRRRNVRAIIVGEKFGEKDEVRISSMSSTMNNRTVGYCMHINISDTYSLFGISASEME